MEGIMKYNRIIWFFDIALLLSVVVRFLQIRYTIDFETGFFLQNSSGIGYFMMGIILAVALASAVFAMNYYKDPEHPPKKGITLGIVSFLPSVAILSGFFSKSMANPIFPWQTILLKLTGLGTILFFILFGIGKFTKLKLPPILTVIPSCYIIIRIITDFAAISSLAVITDYIFLILSYCVILLFFISFAKLYNKISSEQNFRKIFATGLSSSILCLSQSVAHFAINLTSNTAYNHVSNISNFELLSFGLFILVFVFTHFSKENSN